MARKKADRWSQWKQEIPGVYLHPGTPAAFYRVVARGGIWVLERSFRTGDDAWHSIYQGDRAESCFDYLERSGLV